MSTHVYKSFRLDSLIILTLLIVPSIYFIAVSNFFQLSPLLQNTLVHKYATVGSRCGLSLFVIYKILAVTKWNISLFSSLTCSQFSSTLRRCLAAGDITAAPTACLKYSIASFNWPFSLISIFLYWTGSNPRRHLFIHWISFYWTTKLYINFLNGFFILFSYLDSARQNLVIELCCALKIFLPVIY